MEPLPFNHATPPALPARPRRRMRGAIAAGVLVAFGTTIAAWQLTSTPTYSTAVGEQRSVKLDDGSMIYLNTRSRVQVNYSDTAREIRLQQGEALFAVESDPDRPFRVITGDATVRALGTRFNVLRREDQTKVSVVEGSVQITRNGADTTRSALPIQLQLIAGEEARVDSDAGIHKQATPDIGNSVAWQQRRLVFRDTPLQEIAEEFNRYNRRPRFRVADPAIGERLYTGTFDADDPQSLRELLSKEGDLRLELQDGEIAIVTRAPGESHAGR
jgi:transmembrane sensor